MGFDDGFWAVMKKHDVDIREGVEFCPSVSPDGAEGEAELLSVHRNADFGSGSDEVLEDDIQHSGPLVADIDTGSPFLMQG